MKFQVGDKVVHWTYGPGVVEQLDRKVIHEISTDCYVVKINEMTLWVPVSDAASGSLRPPTPADKFEELFDILRSPGKPLAVDRFERRTYLVEQLKSGTLQAICQVVRDLYTLRRTHKMNDHDTVILERSRKFLLTEWEIALAVPFNQAEQRLQELLSENA